MFRTSQLSPMLRTLCMMVVCVTLISGCNEEKQKKVIAQGDEALKTVEASKTAANLANTAQQLLANPASAEINTAELRTVKCGAGAAMKVIAFVPATSSLAQNKVLPGTLASRMKSDLGQRFKPEQIVTALDVDPACGITSSLIAENSPVLQLNNTFAAQAAVPVDDTNVVSIEMTKCPDDASGHHVPGVVTTKKMKDGSIITDTGHCGKPMADNMPNIELSSTMLPNWKERLKGTPDATANIACIVSANGCLPVAAADIGTKIQCSTDPDKDEMVVNPTFMPATATFEPDATPRDCGKGWSGELTAHIQKKQCTVVRSGVTSVPATVFNIAYVSAKCRKPGVAILKSCPAGLPFSDTGKLEEGSDQTMTAPEALVPHLSGDKNISSVAFSRMQGGQLITNADAATTAMVGKAQVLTTATGPRTEQLFMGLTDVSAVVDDSFDQVFVDELTSLNKIRPDDGSINCFTHAQSCMVDFPPTAVDITVDRTASYMNKPIAQPVYALRTTCNATMANLFQADKRVEACAAVKGWKQVAQQYHVTDAVLSNWDYHTEPVRQADDRVDERVQQLDYQATYALNNFKTTMLSALKSQSFENRLSYGLAIGQDCNPSLTADKQNIQTQQDMFGSCAPHYVNNADVMTTFWDPTNNKPLYYQSCQESCPGECITDVDRDQNNKPKGTTMTLMQAVDHYVTNSLVPRLPVNTRSVYGEMWSGHVDAGTGNIFQAAQEVVTSGSAPVVLQDNVPNNDITALAEINPAFYWSEASDNLRKKAALRGVYTAGDKPLIYRSIDAAIDRLRKGSNGTTIKGGPAGTIGADGLDADPNKRASLIVFGSKTDLDCTKELGWLDSILDDIGGWFGADMTATYDRDNYKNATGNKCKTFYSSPYFGRNFCEPEKVPSGYNCHYETKSGFLGLGNKGHDAAIDINDVKARYGEDGWTSRTNWCNAKGYGRHLAVNAVYSGTPTYDNTNSFIGFMHRNFPNVRLYYFDTDGGGLSNFCKTDESDAKGNRPVTKEQGDVYVWDNNTFSPWLHIFSYTDDVGKYLDDGIKESLGGGTATDEAGTYVCKQKYAGVNVTINHDPKVPKPLPERDQTYNTISTATCDPLVTLNPDLPDSTPTPLPPVQTPPYSSPNNNSGVPCNAGYTQYTMQPCTATPQ